MALFPYLIPVFSGNGICFRILASGLICFVMAAQGCAPAKLNQARTQFYSGDIQKAAQTLADEKGIASRSRLLYLMEKGLILFEAGDYGQSIEVLLEATVLINELEIVSVTRQGASLVTSERITPYRGEYAERLFVHTYLMMSYLLIRHYDDALVEAKQAMEVIAYWPDACRKDYFTRALIAHCFEVAGEASGAYIEYRKLAEDLADPLPLARPLCRLALEQGFADEAKTYCQLLTKAGENIPRKKPGAEMIVFVAQGQGPVKAPVNIVAPPSIRFSFARYRQRSRHFTSPAVHGEGLGSAVLITTDVAAVLKDSLGDRAARVMTKEALRVAAKESIAANLEDPLAEALVRLAFFLMEEPDTRGWETLPAYMTMLRAPVLSETRNIRINAAGGKAIYLPEISGSEGPGRYTHFAVRFGRLWN